MYERCVARQEVGMGCHFLWILRHFYLDFSTFLGFPNNFVSIAILVTR